MAAVPGTHTVTGGVATSSEMNTYFRDPVLFMLSPPIAELYQTGAQSIPNAAFTALLFDTETVDKDVSSTGGHSTSVSTSRYTAVYPGWYQVSGGVAFAANATGRRACTWRVNGSSVAGSQVAYPATAASDCEIAARTKLVYLNVGDYVELYAYQESGGALNTFVAASAEPHMSVRWVSN